MSATGKHERDHAHLRVIEGGGEPPRSDRPRIATRERERGIRVVLLAVLVLNLAVAVAKISFGFFSGSLAITADGFHSLLDALANVVALVGIVVASRPPDPNHAYGHHRYETLTSLGIAGLMLLALFGLVQGAWSRLQSGEAPDVSTLSFVVMGVTLSVNVFVTLWERRAARRLSSTLLMADARHTTSDILVSISVIASLVAVQMGFGWADAGITLVIAAAIAWGAWSIVRDASLVLTDAVVAEAGEIADVVRSVPGVQGTHNIRTRGAEGYVWVDLHVQVDPGLPVTDAHDIASAVARRIEDQIGDPADVTVHIEPADERHLRSERGHDPMGKG
ncbi:MAG TPA: cation diffusion facilitator family transporter [Thermomicrobiales bacterium]|nr:cation diffusion facilitator family transporter [Thermomicrobiales bacterium]